MTALVPPLLQALPSRESDRVTTEMVTPSSWAMVTACLKLGTCLTPVNLLKMKRIAAGSELLRVLSVLV